MLIAAGGAGQVYSDTTNPAVATGDGIALALDAGAELADMEFYQFHPTALSLPGAPRFLLSEALRGEGAYLRNDRGERFMERYHPLLELAPRDVVARAITREGMGAEPGETRVVHLDMRHVKGIDLHQRFPGISAVLARYGLESAPGSDSGPPGRALPDGRHPDRPLRPHQSSRTLCGRRGGMHRRSRSQPAGFELIARRVGVWRARGSVHAGGRVAAGDRGNGPERDSRAPRPARTKDLSRI